MAYFSLCDHSSTQLPVRISLGVFIAVCSLLGTLLNGGILNIQLRRSRSNWGVYVTSMCLTIVDIIVCACFAPWLCLHTIWFWGIERKSEDTTHAFAAMLCVASSLVLTLYAYERYLLVIHYGKTDIRRRKLYTIVGLTAGSAVAVFAGASFAIDLTNPAPSAVTLAISIFQSPIWMLFLYFTTKKYSMTVQTDSSSGFNSMFFSLQVRLSTITLAVAFLCFLLWLPFVSYVASFAFLEQHVQLLTCEVHMGMNFVMSLGVASSTVRSLPYIWAEQDLRRRIVDSITFRARIASQSNIKV